jgi:uncharacterized protein YbjQ (UPF0145 family)
LFRFGRDASTRPTVALRWQIGRASDTFPFGAGVREMLMVGTGSFNPALGHPKAPYTSELTGEELWNLTQLGYAPLRLVLGTSVYALGFAGGVSAFFQSFGRGEIDEVTRLVYDARENCLEHIRIEAEEMKADGVIGIKIFINEIGMGLVLPITKCRGS